MSTGERGERQRIEDAPAAPAGVPEATIFVCVSCRRQRDDGFDEPGRALVPALAARIVADGLRDIVVKPVECLAVCKRPCTLALVGPDKWTYVVGDLDERVHVEEIIAAAGAYARSENGIVPWKERPATFRKGVISRIPPMGFMQPVPEQADAQGNAP